ncbi:MAG TPA: cytochrome c oxidase assembly protein [Gemmatimonadales bacterium]|nr:cytochrome c oxidase assembly protein [Gemmatimonadales bacterium]
MTSAVQWWCAATGLPWSWAWQWYPGVHLFLIVMALGWWRLGRRQHWSRRPWVPFLAGWVTLLVAIDWPLGKLGAGYLATAHTIQFLLLTLIVGPMMLRSIPIEGWERLAPAGSTLRRFLCFMARALPGLILFNLIVVTTHFPRIVDGAMGSQLGSFLIDGSWLLAGMILWWPIVAPPAFRRLRMFGKMGYIFGATIVPTIPAMMMVFSTWPLYELYELAPRVDVRLSANTDIQLAGLVMKVLGDIPLWIATAVIFFTESGEPAKESSHVA